MCCSMEQEAGAHAAGMVDTTSSHCSLGRMPCLYAATAQTQRKQTAVHLFLKDMHARLLLQLVRSVLQCLLQLRQMLLQRCFLALQCLHQQHSTKQREVCTHLVAHEFLKDYLTVQRPQFAAWQPHYHYGMCVY